MSWPEHLQKIADLSQQNTEMQMLALQLAGRARRLLNGQIALTEEQLPDFIERLRRLSEWRYPAGQESDEHYRVSSLAGGLAVLTVKHLPWLKTNPKLKDWVLKTLRSLEPVVPEHQHPHVGTDTTSESFLGEAAAALLPDCKEEWVRAMAFEGVTAATYRATFDTMWRAFQMRSELGDTFDELVDVVLYWSALRHAAAREFGVHSDGSKLAKYKSALRERFVAQTSKKRVIVSRTERVGRWLTERVERRTLTAGQREWQILSKANRAKERHDLSREMPELDIEVLRRGLGYLEAAVLEPSRQAPRDLELLRELFRVEVDTFPKEDTQQGWRGLSGTPWDFDRWVLQMAASYIALSTSLDEARYFFEPLLDIGPIAHYWLEDFFRAWVISGLPIAADAKVYVAIWKEMFAYVETLPDWQPRSPGSFCAAEYVMDYMAGLHEDQVKVYGSAEYRPIVSAMEGTMQQWAARWLGYPSLAQWYANFVTTESGKALLSQGIIQFAATVNVYPEDGWSRYSLGTLLAKMLSVAWMELRSEIATREKLRDAFLAILTTLCARLVPEALNLRGKSSTL